MRSDLFSYFSRSSLICGPSTATSLLPHPPNIGNVKDAAKRNLSGTDGSIIYPFPVEELGSPALLLTVARLWKAYYCFGIPSRVPILFQISRSMSELTV